METNNDKLYGYWIDLSKPLVCRDRRGPQAASHPSVLFPNEAIIR